MMSSNTSQNRKNNLLWRVTTLLYGGVLLALLTACTGTKFLKEGESFYTGAEITVNTHERTWRQGDIRTELNELISPKPNTTILGSRPGVWFYYIAGTPKKKKGGLRNFIRNKLGQEPVLLKDVTPQRTAALLAGQLNNEGYFGSQVTNTVKTKGKRSAVQYAVELYPVYRLREINYPKGRDSTYAVIFRTLHEGSLLHPGQRYQLAMLQAEQSRIESVVKNYGFYYFDDRYLIFDADSTVGEHQVDLDLHLEQGVPKPARKRFKVGEVTVYPDYALVTDSTAIKPDTIKVDSFRYIDQSHMFRPKVLTRIINVRPEQMYSKEDQELTLSHLLGLGTFKFVNIKYTRRRRDSTALNASIMLTPMPKKSFRFEAQGVSKSNNFVGPGIAFTFTNRNFLRGAELFQLKLNTSYEVQLSSKIQQPLNSFELGFESTLTVPRFISPIPIDYSSRKFLPKTQFKIAYNLQNRVGFFRLNSFNAGYGYLWKESADRSHELYPVDVNYIRTDKRSEQFETLLKNNPVLAKSFQNQFIIGTRYAYTLNTQLRQDAIDKFKPRKFREHSFYFHGAVDLAGNLMSAIQDGVYGKTAEGEFHELLGSPYSQYVKGDADFRYYWQFDRQNKLATRIVAGVGYAFGNSETLPYIKQFSIGGSNSIRAFPARSIGPGSYHQETSERFIDQRGDIKLEGNVEYRFDIVKSFKGALFLDAGNIWLMRDDPLLDSTQTDPNIFEPRIGGKFMKSLFLDQLAVGTGVGFRFDFSFFVLRFDIAFPLRKPWLEGNKWVFDEIAPLSSTWRSDNLIFNIAIGYPF